MAYGPDDNLNIDNGKVLRFSLNPGNSAHLTFSAGADWEQALIIYDQATMANVVEKGTYEPERNLHPVDLQRNAGAHPVVYLVTGWYKSGGPNMNLGWNQSSGKVLLSGGTFQQIGFDDGHNDGDYNDITVTFETT